MFLFPDISYYQPNADVPGILKESNGILCIRAGNGRFHDPKFDAWRDQAQSARVLMIYYFPKAGISVQESAAIFLGWIGQRRANEVYVLDVEPYAGPWSLAMCQEFMDIVRGAVGGPPLMIYANESYITENGLSSLFTTSSGWIARYGSKGKNDSPVPKYPYIAWQFAADGYGDPGATWPGCPRDTDTNRVEVTPDEFVNRVLPRSDDVALTDEMINKIAKAFWTSDGIIPAPPEKIAEGNTNWAGASYLYWERQKTLNMIGAVKALETSEGVDVTSQILASLKVEDIADGIAACLVKKNLEPVIAYLEGKLQ